MFSREWDSTLESVTDEILRKSNIGEPPVDPLEIARSLEIRVLLDDRLAARALSRDDPTSTAIILGPESATSGCASPRPMRSASRIPG